MRSSAPFDEYLLDGRQVRRAFDRASQTYAGAAGVQAELRTRLLERLDLVRLQPQRVLDLGAASGQSTRLLKQRYSQAQVLAVDLSQSMLREARREQTLFKRFGRLAMDAHALALADSTIDLVFSNLMLAWCNRPDQVFGEIARVLRPDGLLMFTSLGPDTLREVRESFRHIDSRPHVHRFIDMHDLGDALLRTGFMEPVMDSERLTVTFPSVQALLGELKATGSTNATCGRRPALLGRTAFHSLQRELESRRRENGIPVTVEVVYGHAWAGRPKGGRSTATEIRVPLSKLTKSRKT